MENILIKKVYQKVCSYKKIKGGREKIFYNKHSYGAYSYKKIISKTLVLIKNGGLTETNILK